MRETIRMTVGCLLVVFVLFPSCLVVLSLTAGFPHEDPTKLVTAIESLATPWWADIAIGAPLLFVFLVYGLQALGLDDFL